MTNTAISAHLYSLTHTAAVSLQLLSMKTLLQVR